MLQGVWLQERWQRYTDRFVFFIIAPLGFIWRNAVTQVFAMTSSFSNEAAETQAEHERKQRLRGRWEEEPLHSLRHLLVLRTDIFCPLEDHCQVDYICECVLDWTHKRKREIKRSFLQHLFDYPINMSQQGQDQDEQMQRPEVRAEDLTDTRNRLGFGEPAKSKTFEVMEECEKMGKTAPSVFSRARSGEETVLNTRSVRPIRKQQGIPGYDQTPVPHWSLGSFIFSYTADD